MTKITTDRLIIRDFTQDDLTAFHEVKTSEKAMRFIPKIKSNSIEDTKASLDDAIEQSKMTNGRERYFFAIELISSGEFVGSIGYNVISTLKDGLEVGLGYFIHECFWGQGMVSEATKAVFDYAFCNGASKISMGCLTANIASEKIMKRLGMTRVRYLKDHKEFHGKLYDRVIYEMTKSEWER